MGGGGGGTGRALGAFDGYVLTNLHLHATSITTLTTLSTLSSRSHIGAAGPYIGRPHNTHPRPSSPHVQ